jgi:hypothetical protein
MTDEKRDGDFEALQSIVLEIQDERDGGPLDANELASTKSVKSEMSFAALRSNAFLRKRWVALS